MSKKKDTGREDKTSLDVLQFAFVPLLLKANRKQKPPPVYEKSKSVTTENQVSSELQKRLQKRQILNGEGEQVECVYMCVGSVCH